MHTPTMQQSEHSAAPPAMPAADSYIKPVMQDGQRFFAVHSNDGQALALAPTRELAFAFLRQHELTGGEVH